MSKVDQLDHRPAMPPLSQDSWPLSPENAAERGRHRRRRRAHKSSETPLDGETPDAAYDRIPRTAEEPPATKPIEAPQPPPWSGSKMMGASCGSACVGGREAEAAGLQSAGPNAWGSEIMIHSKADRGHTENNNNDDGNGGGNDSHRNCNRRNCVMVGEAEYRGARHYYCGSGSDGATDDDAFSFPSLAIETGPWTVSGSGSDEDENRFDKPRWATKVATDVRATPVTGLATLEAAIHRRKKGSRARDGRTTSSPPFSTAVGNISLTAASPGEGHATRDVDHCLTNHNNRPQPELYDVWVPQQYFRGKALTPSKRWRDTEPGESMPVGKASGAAYVGSQLSCSGPGRRQTSPPARGIPTTPFVRNCQVEMFAVEDGVGQGASSSNQFPPSAIGTRTIPGERTVPRGHRVPSPVPCGKSDGASEFEAADGDGNGPDSTTLIVDEPLLHPDGSMGVAGGGGGGVGRLQEEDESEEYFDYAQAFSWRAAAEMVDEVAAAQRGERTRAAQQGNDDEEFRVSIAGGTHEHAE